MEKLKHQVQNLRDRHHRVSMKYFELKHRMEKAKRLKDALGNITKLGNGALIPAGSIAFQ